LVRGKGKSNLKGNQTTKLPASGSYPHQMQSIKRLEDLLKTESKSPENPVILRETLLSFEEKLGLHKKNSQRGGKGSLLGKVTIKGAQAMDSARLAGVTDF